MVQLLGKRQIVSVIWVFSIAQLRCISSTDCGCVSACVFVACECVYGEMISWKLLMLFVALVQLLKNVVQLFSWLRIPLVIVELFSDREVLVCGYNEPCLGHLDVENVLYLTRCSQISAAQCHIALTPFAFSTRLCGTGNALLISALTAFIVSSVWFFKTCTYVWYVSLFYTCLVQKLSTVCDNCLTLF